MKRLLSAAIGAVSLIAFSSFSQAQEDDPFGGGFAVNKNAEIFAMGTQNDSLHGWAFDWLSSPSDSIILIGESSFPESYLCGDKRDIAAADFNGDYMDELVVAWNRADGGVFVGIPTIDPGTLAPDPAGWHVSDPPGAPGVLYATDALADVLGEIRVVAGNFYPDRAMEFVSAYLAADSTVTLTVFDVDSLTSVPAQMSTISDQAVSTALPALQQFGAVSRFDIAAGDFDGDGLDEIALIASDPAQSPETHLALKIYDYDPSSHTLIPEPSIPYAANADVNHSCLRRVLMETGNFEPDSLDEIAILDHWSRADVDSSRVGTLHTLKLNTAMTGIAASQQQLLPSCSWGEGGGVNGYVGALTTYNGELIVGGGFSKAGYTPVNNIASWDGTRWKPLGSGVNDTVWALAVYGGNLIAGGNFTEAGGVHATNIARWDGSTWEEFAGGITDYGGVMALLPSTISLGDLYVVGRFTVVGGVGANNVARWDGSAWYALGSGLDDMANNIIENADSSVTVVGQFDNAGGKAAHNIAKWSNGTWYAYGSGLDYPADAVIYDSVPGTTVVAGWFYNAGGNTANHIAFWDGAWHAVGPPGLNDEARALCLEPGGDGDFYVGGRFTTAGGTNANSIVRRNYGVSWQPLGKGLTYPSGFPGVYALYFHGGDLIAGGSFDHADDTIHAGNIARWDGSQWHAFESQEFFPIGLAVGRFDVNSELDDIAITACRAVSGYLMQYLCVYGVDTLSAPLTLCQKWEADISEFWSVEGLARSRRLIAVDDVTGNGQADLAVLCSQSVAPGIRIYEPVPDALCTFSSMPAPEDWISSDNLTHLVLADLDTLTVTIGPPMTYHVDSVVQPLAIIYAPPVHYDTLNDTTWDVSNRYPLPPDDSYDTYVQYCNSSSFETTTQTEMHRDWGVSVGLETWAETGGWSASAYLETEYGEGFSKQGGYSEQITIGATITAKDDDQLHAVRVSYDILEYPVLRGGETMGRIVVVSPSLVEQGWSPVKMRESLIPNHEVDNILSYPPPSDILNNPMMASGIIGNASEFYTMQAAAPSTWYLGQQRFTESSVSTSWDLTVEAGVSAGYEGGFKIFGMGVEAGFEVSLDANYGVGQVSTFSTSFSTTDSLHLELGLINSSGSYSGNRQYEVTPYAYWAKNGALVIDYAVSPLANPPDKTPPGGRSITALPTPLSFSPGGWIMRSTISTIRKKTDTEPKK